MPGGDFDSPSSEEVTRIHEKADTDGGMRAAHHTLGPRKEQASPGNHSHDGGESVQLLDGISITGSRSSGAALISIIDLLQGLGATDATST